MFTGIIEEIGRVELIKKNVSGSSISIETKAIYSDVKIGDSIAINGICLTVTNIDKKVLSFDVMKESFDRTALDSLKTGSLVNLERSLKLDSRLGGHFVSGHVDYKGKIISIIKDKSGVTFSISLPLEFSKFVAPKGSITLDGISLTVGEVERERFNVYLIPHTLKATTLGMKKNGDFLNVEVDLISKYLSRHTKSPSLEGLLKKYDYM
ncbi:MAG: riboflavin synthase [Candidatus Omnitrophota bacterium]